MIGSKQQVIGLPGSLGRPTSSRFSRGQILEAVCQDTRRLSERGDTVLKGEHAPVQGGLRFLVTSTRLHVHGMPLSADDAGMKPAACALLSPFFQDTTTGPGW